MTDHDNTTDVTAPSEQRVGVERCADSCVRVDESWRYGRAGIGEHPG